MKQTLFLLSVLLFGLAQAQAAIAPADAIMASSVKRNQYHSQGIIWGGDALANPMVLENIRWAPNGNFERIVVDLTGDGSGWETKIPPYFQVGISPSKILVSLRGISRRALTGEKLAKSLARSSLIVSTYMAPALEGDLASFEIQTRKPVSVESFYLVNPPRLIMDLRGEK
jgi:hypothetical protein